MSVVAWDGKTLAADKRACIGTLVRTTTKIHRVGDALVGYSGCADAGETLIAWLRAGADPAGYPATQSNNDSNAYALVIRRGQILMYERAPHPIRFDWGQQIAIGCGRDYAMAAMHLGKTAAEAVAVASALDSGCGNGLDTLELMP